MRRFECHLGFHLTYSARRTLDHGGDQWRERRSLFLDRPLGGPGRIFPGGNPSQEVWPRHLPVGSSTSTDSLQNRIAIPVCQAGRFGPTWCRNRRGSSEEPQAARSTAGGHATQVCYTSAYALRDLLFSNEQGASARADRKSTV